jgi:uncharacterized protein (TIGR02217 family)
VALPLFPSLKGVAFPVKRAPIFRTMSQESVSGMDNPIELWAFPRWAYELTYTVLRSDIVNQEWQTLATFFLGQRGKSRVFQFTDPDDGSVTDQLFGVGDGVTAAFPLVRTLSGGSFTFSEPVFAPTITNIKDNGTPTAAYTLGTQGLVTFNTPPTIGHSLTWTGTYNWLCRFDTDGADFQKFLSQFWELRKINFTTIKTQSK